MNVDEARVVIVTGGGQQEQVDDDPSLVGVGAAVCQTFAGNGLRVAVVDHDATAATRTADRIAAGGGESLVCQVDVTSAADVDRCVQEVLERWGRIDVLVNSAAVLGVSGPDDLTPETWKRVLDVNLLGTLAMSKRVVDHLPPGGSIVNVASIAGFRPGFGSISYSVSKGALLTLTKALAVQLGRKQIRVNAVCPGSIWTPMALRSLPGADAATIERIRGERQQLNLLGREGTAWDIAEGVAFLAGSNAKWITGQVLTIDGGATVEPTRAMAGLPRDPIF